MGCKKYQFRLNTSKQCFLCFKEIQKRIVKNTNGFKDSKVSLQNVFRYLNINLSEISALSNKPASLLNNTEDVRVSLCNDCEKQVEKFTKLFEDLEVCKMKVDSSLKEVLIILEGFNGEFQNDFYEGLKHCTSLMELRHKVLTELKSKTENFQRLTLQKLHPSVENKAKMALKAFEDSSFTPNIEGGALELLTDPVCDSFEELKLALIILKRCFLCLRDIQISNSDNFCETDFQRRTYSLISILRYLGISLSQNSCLSKNKTASLVTPEIQASLCRDCGSSTEQFTKHFEALEVIEMKVNSSLKDISVKLKSNGAVFNLEDEKSLKHSEIVIELRQRIITESKSKAEKYLPKVILQKIRMEKIPAPKTASLTPGEDTVVGTEPVFEAFQHDHRFTLGENGNDSFPEIESTQEIKPLLGKTAKQNNHRLTRPCPHCGKQRFKAEGLNLHLITVHRELLSEEEFKNIKKHECHLCSKYFRDNFDLVRHLRRHTGHRPFSCSKCDKSYTRKDSLFIHEKTIHGKISSQNIIRNEKSGEKEFQSGSYHQPAEIEMEIEQDSLPILPDPLGEPVKVEAVDEVSLSLVQTPQLELLEENSNIKMQITSDTLEDEEIVKEAKDCQGHELKAEQCRFCRCFLWPDDIQKHLLAEHLHLLSPVELEQMDAGKVALVQC